ncbi:helix-turn-helix transcriptional regulator [Streptomyces sp. CHD11]|uniref:helix-turn-helix transcriptional regulator n=1 Tax=Streptomyces sp. CHD11 TaxID=2741325 RepID=UPI001BFCC423|nr:helix-turn-helix transcriptional regulator [Streptomyces sp. CHD11]MBT3154585.1 helix-turn-helix transcriptional regulator [Streptomyces sp. CHD11]
MCNPALRQALIAAHRLLELARLRRVRDRIDREYTRPLDVEALARDADMPPGQLGRRFRDAYGLSPYAYLTVRRVEHAMALLRHGDHGPAELGRAVGCPSTAVLVARFTELAGMPPGVYRRLAAAGTPGLPWRVTAPVPSSSRNGEATANAPHLALLP